MTTSVDERVAYVATYVARHRVAHPFMPRGIGAFVWAEGTLYHHAEDDVSTNEAIAKLKVLFIPPTEAQWGGK